MIKKHQLDITHVVYVISYDSENRVMTLLRIVATLEFSLTSMTQE